MRSLRTPSYAVAVAALAVATLGACGTSADGSASGSAASSAASPTATSVPTSSGRGDLQLRQATAAQTPAMEACTSAPVPPREPTYRCDQKGAGYALGPAFVTGAMVESAQAEQTADGPQVDVTLDAAGTKALAAATTRMSSMSSPDNLLGIMSGGHLYGALQVQAPVTDGQFVISGLANMADAVSLAASIRG
jgi:preprotein translocase subunit SecD